MLKNFEPAFQAKYTGEILGISLKIDKILNLYIIYPMPYKNKIISLAHLCLLLSLAASKCTSPEHRQEQITLPSDKPPHNSPPKWASIHSVGNSCYANTLIHMLYFTPGFKEALGKAIKASNQDSMAHALNEVFKAIGEGDTDKATQAMQLLKKYSSKDHGLSKGHVGNPMDFLARESGLPFDPSLKTLIDDFFSYKRTTSLAHVESVSQPALLSGREIILPLGIHDNSQFLNVGDLQNELSGLRHPHVITPSTTPEGLVTEKKLPEEALQEYLATVGEDSSVERNYYELGNNFAISMRNPNREIEKMRFPLYFNVEMLAFLESKPQPIKYTLELYAIGVFTGGNHYYALVKTSDQDQSWYKFDFGHVSKIQPAAEGKEGYFEFPNVSKTFYPALFFYHVKRL